MEKDRFSMLLLDPGEILFEDYSIKMKLEVDSRHEQNEWIEGRLKMCSKSLVFVCKELEQPLIKIQLKEITTVEKFISETNSLDLNHVLLVKCKQHIEMFEGNQMAPYKFKHEKKNFYFKFNYANIDDCLSQVLQLIRAATLPIAEQNAMIMAIVHSRQCRFKFDTSWLEDICEQIICEIQVSKVLPLIINPGRILLTNCRLYFQPYNNMGQHPVLKIDLKSVQNVIKRRFLLRQIGLEIKWIHGVDSKIQYFFMATKNEEQRDQLYKNLLSQSALKIETVLQHDMTMRWQYGHLSNFDYLLYINSLGDRTFHDLTQYPIMPWVITDYSSEILDLNDSKVYRNLSKPIGALETSRLHRLKERYLEMPEPKFLYGSHYSAPGFVLFYLVRKYPQYMLCLQNGRFDHPDRMFNSIADVWKNVLVNLSDFKELIPEFYDPSNGGDFLINESGIDFGTRHDGSKIGDVQLPPWATDPSDFIQKLRNALESDKVSNTLHNWIDLIFGFKQKGEEALKANNIFFHLCYEGAIDLDTIKDINERHGLEVQIMEFGQVPKQVFKMPHPKRLLPSNSNIRNEMLFSAQPSTSGIPVELKKLTTFQSHKKALSALIMISDENKEDVIVSVGHDGLMKMYSLKTEKVIRSACLSSVPLYSCISYKTPSNSNILVVGSSDNLLLFYDIEYGKVYDSLLGHEDVVTCLAYSQRYNVIVSSSWDCSTKVWKTSLPGKKIKPVDCFVKELIHDCQVTCMDICRDQTLLATGTEDGEIFLWSIKESCNLQFTIKEYTCKVNSITFEPDAKNIVSCTSDKSLGITDIQTSTQIYLTTLDEEAISMGWVKGYLAIGDKQGFLHLWNPLTTTFIFKHQCHQGSLIAMVTDGTKVVTAGEDKKIEVWTL